MKDPKHKSAKYLYRVGSYMIGALIIIPPLLLILVLEYLKLNTLEQGIDGLNEWFGLYFSVYAFVLVSAWIFLGNKWADWARYHVHPDEQHELEYKIASKDSFFILRWAQMGLWKRVQRVLGIGLLIAIVFVARWYYNDQKGWKDRPVNTSTAFITKVYKRVKRKSVQYKVDFTFLDSTGMEVQSATSVGSGLLGGHAEKNGFELLVGDGFELVYDPTDVSHSAIDFFQPTDAVLTRYRKRALGQLATVFKEPVRLCMVNKVEEEWGVMGLGILRNQDTGLLENGNFNSLKFTTLSEDSVYRAMLAKCFAETDLNTP